MPDLVRSGRVEIPDLDAIRAERMRRDFAAFVRGAWHVVEPAVPYQDGWHIGAICEHLQAVTEGEIRQLLINVPPRHMKSLLVGTFWPAWEWITHPSRRWLFASYALDLASDSSVSCRKLIQSDWYQARWGSKYQLAGDQNVKLKYDTTKGGRRMATAVDAGTTGHGGDRLVVDDPHNAKKVESEADRKQVLAWWRLGWSTRGNDPKTVARVVVMQRVHAGDLSGYLLGEGGWDHLCLAARYDGPRGTTRIQRDPRTEAGQLLWPERYGAPELAQLEKDLGSYGTAAQLQQRPSPAEGGIFKRAWWGRWHKLPAAWDRLALSVDCAFKGTADSDFVVIQLWGQSGAKKYLLHQVRDRMTFSRTCAAITHLLETWRDVLAPHLPPDNTWPQQVEAVWVEDKANGEAVMDTLQAKVPGLIPITPDGGKDARAWAVQPTVEAGDVLLPGDAAWVDGYIEEAAQFPKGANDDQVDATTQALRKMADQPFAFV